MRLSEERNTYIIGIFLTFILSLQLIGNYAGGEIQARYQRINWLLSHSAKTNALLANFANLFILDREHTVSNLAHYKESLARAKEFHESASRDEKDLFQSIALWKKIEVYSNLLCIIFIIIVMWLYLGLIKMISKRLGNRSISEK
jgi:hypothetical protein